MMRITFLFIILFQYSVISQPLTLKLTESARGFTSPVYLTAPHDGTNRLFVVEQGGKIKIVHKGSVLPTPFIDVSDKLDGLNIAYSEKGLLGFTFHPDYKTNGKFYIYYSAPVKSGGDHKSILSEFKVSNTNSNKADMASERIILEQMQPESNHNGGQLAFGPDGYLYIGFGDGGGANDEHGKIGNGQDPSTWLGKIIRIDVNVTDKKYAVPSDNPFVNNRDYLPEIWATGLRNPWRFSFDRGSQQLFCADVGQNKYEEINIIRKGKNYGWRIMEGFHCFNPAKDCDREGLTAPVVEYDHSEGISVIGGYVYRGMEYPSLHGTYIFGDWNGKLWTLNYNSDKKEWVRYDLMVDGTKKNEIDGKINSFGEDENGNIYIVTQKLFGPKSPTGVIYKISR